MRGLAFVVALAGCDSLASHDYVGEPMFQLVGTFDAAAQAPEDPVGGIALLWQDAFGASGPGVAPTAVPVAIEFPSTFKVDIPTPPPPEVRFRFGDADVELAEAYVYVVADPKASRLVPRGSDRAHVLVYASGDVPAGTRAAEYFGEPLTAGYHLRRFAPVMVPAAAQAELIERCVAGGAARPACVARRGYQLATMPDDDPLRIAVAPP